jgi:hypothetical protein
MPERKFASSRKTRESKSIQPHEATPSTPDVTPEPINEPERELRSLKGFEKGSLDK